MRRNRPPASRCQPFRFSRSAKTLVVEQQSLPGGLGSCSWRELHARRCGRSGGPGPWFGARVVGSALAEPLDCGDLSPLFRAPTCRRGSGIIRNTDCAAKASAGEATVRRRSPQAVRRRSPQASRRKRRQVAAVQGEMVSLQRDRDGAEATPVSSLRRHIAITPGLARSGQPRKFGSGIRRHLVGEGHARFGELPTGGNLQIAGGVSRGHVRNRDKAVNLYQGFAPLGVQRQESERFPCRRHAGQNRFLGASPSAPSDEQEKNLQEVVPIPDLTPSRLRVAIFDDRRQFLNRRRRNNDLHAGEALPDGFDRLPNALLLVREIEKNVGINGDPQGFSRRGRGHRSTAFPSRKARCAGHPTPS